MNKPVESIPEGVRHIHCIGIGGSGMFPLVQILHGRGYTITGSDNNESDIVELERALGIQQGYLACYLVLIHSYISFLIIRISVPTNGSLRNSPSILEQICGV